MTHFCSILEDYPAIVVRFRLSRVRKWHLSKRHLMQNSPYLAYVSFSLKTKIHYLWELLGHLWGSHLWWWHSFPCFMCMNAVLPLYTDFVLELTEKDFGLSSESLWRSCLEGKKKKQKQHNKHLCLEAGQKKTLYLPHSLTWNLQGMDWTSYTTISAVLSFLSKTDNSSRILWQRRDEPVYQEVNYKC